MIKVECCFVMSSEGKERSQTKNVEMKKMMKKINTLHNH